MKNISINGDRLWQSLMEMARFGATKKGGCCRLALTDLDRQARDLFIEWCRDAGCDVRIDAMGNIFARRAGRDDSLPPVMTGSHLDTQPTGGKFDGVYGVLAGLEVLRTLNDHGYETDAPVEVSMWTNEEGARFAPAMTGSGVYAGVIGLEEAHRLTDVDGVSLGGELERIGYLGQEPCGGREIGTFIEIHIEQGPILEAEGKTIGVVTGAQGQKWYEVVVTGAESHAGTTPMDRRRDALLGASRMVDAINRIGVENPPHTVTTVGMLESSPNSRNTIPGRVFFTIDVRHPAADTLTRLDKEVRNICTRLGEESGLEVEIEQIADTPPVVFNSDCAQAISRAAETAGLGQREMISGAGHDACHISAVAPTAMIFVPCKDGVSHNEEESATPEDLAQGCDVLLHAILDRAQA